MSPGTDAVSLRTSNRNFEARSGTRSAHVYLVSPETAAAAALTGEFTDPRPFMHPLPPVDMPAHFDIDDSLFLFRDTAGRGVPGTVILRGPNIGQVPPGLPVPSALDGVVTIKVGDKITTDHIMPAGARLKYRSNIPEYAKYVFENVDPTFHDRALAYKSQGIANIIIAGESYGQGSSREHAAMCPMYLGVRLLIAKSAERIHTANLINFGIVPFYFDNPADYDTLQPGDRLESDSLLSAVLGDGRLTIRNTTRGTSFTVATTLSDRQKNILANGGLLATVAKTTN